MPYIGVLITVGVTVATGCIAALKLKSLNNDTETVRLLRDTGTTVQVVVDDLTCSKFDENHPRAKFSIEFMLHGSHCSVEISKSDWDNLKVGYLVPVTYANGFVRFNILSEPLDSFDFPEASSYSK